MRMKVSTRIIFSIFICAVALLCLYLLACIFGLLPADGLASFVYTIQSGGFWYQALYVVIFGVVLIVGICLLFFGIKKDQPRTAVVAAYENGVISITISALEELAAKYVRQTGAVKGMAIKVRAVADKIDLHVKISILPDVNIPDITRDLQVGLIQYMEGFTGIRVREAKVAVASIDETIKTNKVTMGGN